MKKRSIVQSISRQIFSVEWNVQPSHFYIQCLLHLILVLWGLSLFDDTNFKENPIGPQTILDNINLIFHEAGHIIFMPFGNFLHAFGGTLLQCLIPLLIMGQFLRQKNNFSASVGLWWFAQNLFDLAPYIYDAWDLKLNLLGGITGKDNPDVHDWYALLTMTDSLRYHGEIANFVVLMGKFFFLCSFLWGGVILYKKFLIINRHNN